MVLKRHQIPNIMARIAVRDFRSFCLSLSCASLARTALSGDVMFVGRGVVIALAAAP